jgi:hypothetical protein
MARVNIVRAAYVYETSCLCIIWNGCILMCNMNPYIFSSQVKIKPHEGTTIPKLILELGVVTNNNLV